MDLPDTLAPWAPYLRLFDPPLGLALGETVRRLAMLLGPLPVPRPNGDVPDGYDGLARRGPYERLLSSEWALASAVPLEFLRRAVMGEHAFLAPAFRGTGASRHSVALFDTGPAQLGTPRVAQIAALVVLARRAEVAGVPFSWGVLSKPGVLLSGLTAASLLHLVQGRSERDLDDHAREKWRETLAREIGPRRDGADLWIVGGRRALAAFEDASSLAIDDVLELGVRRVSVEARPHRGAARSALLEVPPVADAIRVLRDPYRGAMMKPPSPTPPPGARPLDLAADLVFSYDARRLLTLEAPGTLVAHFIPNSPSARGPNPARFSPPVGQSVVAAGQTRSGLEVLTTDGEQLWLFELGPRGGSRRAPRSFAGKIAPAPHRLSPLHVFGPWAAPSLVFLDDAGGLHLSTRDQSTRLADAVIAFWRHHSTSVWAVETAEGVDVRAREDGSGDVATTTLRGATTPVFFGYWGPYAPVLPGMIAARTRTGWTLRTDKPDVALLPSSDTRVIGVGAPFRNDREPCLLVIDGTSRIMALGRRISKVVVSESSPITRAVVGQYGPHLAYVTEAGHLVVYDLLRDGQVMRVASPREASP